MQKKNLLTFFPPIKKAKNVSAASQCHQKSCRFEQLEQRLVLSTNALITEFMAANDSTLADGNGNYSDWIEIHNPLAISINLEGWHLTDDDNDLAAWTFPEQELLAGEYLIVFASGQATDDYVDSQGYLHTNFKLSSGGEYLALTNTAENVIYEFAPEFPSQSTDVSFGIDPNNSPLGHSYFVTPTPGATNSTAAVTDQVVFSQTSQTFSEPFSLALSGTTNNSQKIYYTLDGSLPGPTANLYSEPITIDSTTQVRTRIREPGKTDGPLSTGSFSRLGADVLAFQSQLPILLIENFGAGSIPAKGWNQTGENIQQVARQSTAITLFDNNSGFSSFQGPTELTTRAGIRGRGAYSTTFPEPQYSVETWSESDDDHDVSVFGIAKESDWILYAPNPALDQTLMNNQFMYGLAEPTTVWAPDVQYVEAFVNQDGGEVTMADHVGLYVWTEKVKRSAGRLDFDSFAEDGSSGGWLLSINRMDASPVDNPGASPQYFHTAGPNGVVQTTPNNPGGGDDIPRQYNAFLNFEHPNGFKINSPQRQAIEDWFAEMEDVLYDRTSVDWNDPTEGYAKYIDVDNFVDYYILHNLSKNSDGLLLSMWVYNPDPNNGGKLKFGPPWDHDLGSFEGNASSNLKHNSDRLWYARLFQDPAFEQRYQDRWQMWRESILSDAGMNQVFDDFVAMIGNDAFIRDGVTDVTSRINTAKNWLSARAATLDSQFLPIPELNQNGGEVAPGFEAFLTTLQGDIYYTTNGTDPRLPDGNINPQAILYNGSSLNTSLIPTESEWNYLDDGSNQGTAWRQISFNDNSWQSGNAQLGYGDGDETTTVGYIDTDSGNSGIQKNITTYFRKKFQAAEPSELSSLTLRLLRDDGASVYLNGTEVARTNLPGTLGDGNINYTTPALTAVGGTDETTLFYNFAINPTLLVDGENTIAVEIHQAGPDSSDISFDLELFGSISTSELPIILTQSTTLTARSRNGSGWSGVRKADFFVGTQQVDSGNLAITEIHYSPYPAQINFGELDLAASQFEFIELLNLDEAQTVDLNGALFSAGIAINFETFTPLAPGERVVIVKDQAAFESRYGTSHTIVGTYTGSLANGGEELQLEDRLGNIIQQFTYNDSSAWPGRADGKGASLEVINTANDYNDPQNWRSSNEFGGSPGLTGAGKNYDVIVNEVLSHSEGALLDKVELYNTTSATIDLSGWHLSDTSNNYFLYTFDAGVSIGAGEYLVLDQNILGFALDGQQGDDIWLLQGAPNNNDKLTRFADHHHFDATATNVSLGRIPNGNPFAPGASLFPMTSQTFGAANNKEVVGDAIISEIMFNPAPVPAAEVGNIDHAELEFVELYNNTAAVLDLGGWKLNLRSGDDLVFAANTIVPANETLLVVSFDPTTEPAKAAAFRHVYNLNVSTLLVGPFGGSLNDSGEPVKLMRPEDPTQPASTGFILVDRVSYEDASPWPTNTNGTGHTIHRNNGTSFGNFATSWNSAAATPGSITFVTIHPGDFEPDGDVDHEDLAIWQSSFGNTVGANTPNGDADHDGDVDGADFLTWQRNFGHESESLSALAFPTVSSHAEQATPTSAILPLNQAAPIAFSITSVTTNNTSYHLEAAKRLKFTSVSTDSTHMLALDQAFAEADFNTPFINTSIDHHYLSTERSHQTASKLIDSLSISSATAESRARTLTDKLLPTLNSELSVKRHESPNPFPY